MTFGVWGLGFWVWGLGFDLFSDAVQERTIFPEYDMQQQQQQQEVTPPPNFSSVFFKCQKAAHRSDV